MNRIGRLGIILAIVIIVMQDLTIHSLRLQLTATRAEAIKDITDLGGQCRASMNRLGAKCVQAINEVGNGGSR